MVSQKSGDKIFSRSSTVYRISLNKCHIYFVTIINNVSNIRTWLIRSRSNTQKSYSSQLLISRVPAVYRSINSSWWANNEFIAHYCVTLLLRDVNSIVVVVHLRWIDSVLAPSQYVIWQYTTNISFKTKIYAVDRVRLNDGKMLKTADRRSPRSQFNRRRGQKNTTKCT